ncbi:MAG: glycosyltransferase family 39 protein [Bryobacteraceae bacterium]
MMSERINRKSAAFIASLLVLIGTLRIISTYRVFNHTIDEPDQLAAGMEWLSIHKYRYEDQHPPLARVFGAIGPYLSGERFQAGPNAYMEGYRILGHGEHYDRILSLGRLGILPFFWIGSAVVFLWAYRGGGSAAAIVSTLLFTTLPPILAHSGLITTDMAVTAFIGATLLASIYWAENPSRVRTCALGVVFGLALLSKFTAAVFVPAAWVSMWVTYAVYSRKPVAVLKAEIAGRRKSILVIAAIAFFVIWAGYLFSFARVPYLHCRLPAPRFFAGLHSVWKYNEGGHPSYLLGQDSKTGFWYYYPVVLFIKTPLAMIGLVLWATWTAFRKRLSMDLLLALMCSCGILLAASLSSRINIGVRYVLAIYIGLAVAVGICASGHFGNSWKRLRAGSWILAGLILSHVISGIWQHPDYLAYTNLVAGNHPENWVADSDLDWGQDMKRLGMRLQQAGAAEVTFIPFNRTYALAGHPFPRMLNGNIDRPSPGWNAVSITIWKVFGEPHWANRFTAQERIGRSILLWYFEPDKKVITIDPKVTGRRDSKTPMFLRDIAGDENKGLRPVLSTERSGDEVPSGRGAAP